MSTPISQRQYARHRGVSEPAVAKWKKLGRVHVLPDGQIDKEISDVMLDARPEVYRGGVVGGTPAGWRKDASCSGMTLAELEAAVEAAAAGFTFDD
jgi:hypothetical protein